MKFIFLSVLILSIGCASSKPTAERKTNSTLPALTELPINPKKTNSVCKAQGKFKLLIHGGTGSILIEEPKKSAVEQIMRSGFERLNQGGTALDAVTEAVAYMEESGIFNAGKGAVKNIENKAQLDSSIMDGKTMYAGAVGAIELIKNPVRVARHLLDAHDRFFLVGPGARAYAVKNNFEETTVDYYQTAYIPKDGLKRHGTVGAVALDRCGNLAAATSTGGLEQKPVGRLGDSPVIGAGTYANNKTAAISASGAGEYFIRAGAAHRVSSAIEFGKMSLQNAVKSSIEKVRELGGEGGIIALNAKGEVSVEGNSPFEGMWVDEKNQIGHKVVKIAR